MTKPKQLTAACRKAIEVLLSEKYTVSVIARKLEVHKSTISREVARCKKIGMYDAQIAQWNFESNRKHSGKKKKLDITATQQYVVEHIIFGWSPEQISGRTKLEKNLTIFFRGLSRYFCRCLQNL